MSSSPSYRSQAPPPLNLSETLPRRPYAPVRQWTSDTATVVEEFSDGTSSGMSTPMDYESKILCLTPVRTPDHSKVIVPRHDGRSPGLYGPDVASPASTSVHSVTREVFSAETGTAAVRMEKVSIRLAAGFFAYFCCGWSDGATATVLPYLMKEYKLSFVTSSLMYAASTIGFVSGTFLLELVLRQLGRIHPARSKFAWLPYFPVFEKNRATPSGSRHSPAQALHLALVYATSLFSLYFCLMGSRTGFPSLFMAYILISFSRGILGGCLNPFFSSVAPMHVSYAHAFWSFGTVIAPLICQTALSKGVPWPYFYYGSLVFAGFNILLTSIAFAPTPSELEAERRKPSCDTRSPSPACSPSDVKEKYFPVADATKAAPPPSMLRIVLSHPFQWAANLFVAFYFATETTSQAFIVTYLLGHRHADPKTAGYVPAGFFAGMMTGRIVWGIFSRTASYERRRLAVFGCLFIALTMQILILVLGSVSANAVCVAFVGLMFGPMFPAAVNTINDIYPSEQKLLGMAILAAGSSCGCAVLPLVLGVLMNSKGVHVLPIWNTAVTAAIITVWACLPSKIPSTGSKWLSQKH